LKKKRRKEKKREGRMGEATVRGGLIPAFLSLLLCRRGEGERERKRGTIPLEVLCLSSLFKVEEGGGE